MPEVNRDSSPALLITCSEDEWLVWMTLPRHDPLRDSFGFVIGQGATRDDAVGDAVQALELAVDRLQSPPGVVEERDIPDGYGPVDHRVPETSKHTLHGAFVAGAKWWEFESTQGTMWASDRDKAWDKADALFGRLARFGDDLDT